MHLCPDLPGFNLPGNPLETNWLYPFPPCILDPKLEIYSPKTMRVQSSGEPALVTVLRPVLLGRFTAAEFQPQSHKQGLKSVPFTL